MSRPSRKEHEVEAVREAILDAATRVFARGGYQSVTMAEIAAEARYTAPALYNYFGGKEEIFAALVERLNREFLATFDEPPTDLPFDERLRGLIERQTALAEQRRDAFTMFMAIHASAGALPSEAAKSQMAFFDRFMERLTSWLAEALEHGGPSGRDPAELAWFFWGIGHAFHLRWMRTNPDAPLAHTGRAVLDLFLHGARGNQS